VKPSSGSSDLGRFIRQRRELGEDSWVLDELPRSEALELAAHVTVPTQPPEVSSGVASHFAEPTHLVPEETGASDLAGSSYDELKQEAIGCTRCRLASGRGQVVFSDGNPTGRVMVVGEAPGANEDRTGLPFVGAAGKLLDLLLATVDLSRKESVYICNVIKCRPPDNRNPRPDEIAACSPFLHRQIALVRPEVILAVGTFSAQLLTGQERPLGKLRGEVYAYEGTPLIVTYHPAALLRNPGWTRSTWDDLQLLRQTLSD